MQSIPISSVGRDPALSPDMEDDMSTATPPIGYRISENDQEFISKTLRFYFPPTDRTRLDRIDPSVIHTQWMRIIQSSFGADVKIINNNNKPVINIDTAADATKNAASHQQQFKTHYKQMGFTQSGTTKTAVTIVHRILIRVPFSQVKRHPSAFQVLKENNCFLREHLWDEIEWDVHQIGFVTGYNPKYYSPEKATMTLRARLCKALPREKIPKFHMVLKTHKITHQDRSSSTQAFAIEVPMSSVSKLLPAVKEVTKGTTDFVPFQMRRKNQDAFQGAIRYQNHLLANQEVVMINNLGTEAMYYLIDRIRAISGVKDVIPTKKVNKTGKFYILVDKNAATGVRESLKKRFDRWYQEVVPEDAKPKPGQFDGPPGVGPPRTDGYSSGENTWMTASTKSFMSFSVAGREASELDDGQQIDLDNAWAPAKHDTSHVKARAHPKPPVRTHASYASATVSDQVSGMTEPDPVQRDLKHEELSGKIATLEAMIMRLCQQVQALTETSTHNQHSPNPEVYAQHPGKRQDLKDTPKKYKRAQQLSAHSSAEEDTQEKAPMEEDRLTAWDDYLPQHKDDQR